MEYKDNNPSRIFIKEKKSKKEDEKDILKNFLLRIQLTYEDIIESEKPDFIIEFPNNLKVGCEVTRFYSDNKGRKFIAEWKRFAQKLKKELIGRNKNYRYIMGSVHFKKLQNLNSLINDEFFIKELADIVDNSYKNLKEPSKRLNTFVYGNFLIEELIDIPDERYKKFYSKMSINFIHSDDFKPISQTPKRLNFRHRNGKFNLIRENIDHIYLRNIYPDEQYLWWPSHLQSGEIPPTQKALEEIISKYNKKAGKYKIENLYQKWLIIFAEGLGLNDICCNVGHLEQKLIQETSYFTNIYVFDKFTESITQVYPVCANVFSGAARMI
jgi:hypothetical protein